jgi:hypothetical protein
MDLIETSSQVSGPLVYLTQKKTKSVIAYMHIWHSGGCREKKTKSVIVYRQIWRTEYLTMYIMSHKRWKKE